ncbi:MAG: tRNA (adenosine(37)-N6)-threonylcarbamoyltransferase complex transferase subunit TsaD [Opitutales bacterium]|nr:tRNA (adenosine(37)-N6)-threonylcarbamoyltransferase complex transferase subunit TsaD [Opitutales bacterium]
MVNIFLATPGLGNFLIIGMIIGIESSCDESGLSVFDRVAGVLWNDVYSQIDLHAEYGGVVPELAVREHIKTFPILLSRLIRNFNKDDIDSIAVTVAPGLPGCLAIGQAVAHALAIIWNKPIKQINHLDGHIFSPFIEVHKQYGDKFPEMFHSLLPHLSLLVSGGNTRLQIIDSFGKLHVLADTQDDAAGEAFDKGAKLLGLPYPGGHLIEKFARLGNPKRYDFPRAYRGTSELKFSFSGLKTSLRYFLENESEENFERNKCDICASYQEAIIDALVEKVELCLTDSPKSVGVCGGVSNNQVLHDRLFEVCSRHEIPLLVPDKAYTGDNAAMIAFAAYIEEVLNKD